MEIVITEFFGTERGSLLSHGGWVLEEVHFRLVKVHQRL